MPTTAARMRAFAGAACTVLFFVVGLVGQFAFPDPAAAPAATGWVTLATAALFLGTVFFLAGATRARGSAWGAAGVVLGLLGFAGHALIGMHAFFQVALATLPTAQAASVESALQATAGWLVPVLMTCSVLSLTAFSIGLVRERTVRWPIAVGGIAMAVLALVPVPIAGQALLPIGLVVFGWAAWRIVATRDSAGWLQPPASRARLIAGATAIIVLMVVSVVKDAVFSGSTDIGAALADAAVHPVGPAIEGFLALTVGILYAGATAFFGGSARSRDGRGSGLAAVGTALGVPGAVVIVCMSVLDFATGALAQAGVTTAQAARMFDALGAVIFPAFTIVFAAEGLMLVAFAAAVWRARMTGWIPFALSVVFGGVAAFGASGMVAVAQMTLGLVVVAWLAVAVVRAGARGVESRPSLPDPTLDVSGSIGA